MRPRCLAVLAAAILTAMMAVAAFAQTPISQLHCNDANGVPLLNGHTVTVRGIVTSMNPTTSGGFSRLYIQDATGGVNVFGLPLYCGSLGDDITVTGAVQSFTGITEVAGVSLAPLSITVNSTGNPQPAALPLTIAQAAYFGHREHSDRSIVNTWIGIVNTEIGDRERSVATPGVQASS